ncbi:MAG: carbonate dehydratase [Hyphomonadaceae bacterium]
MCDTDIESLFENNKTWAQSKTAVDAGFFTKLSNVQSPDYLWIGCSDSRVPANEIVGLQAGELFVHRNIANVVPHADMNCLSVIQYAVEVLNVKHIIVTGHYGCGGIRAAMSDKDYGQIENWLAHIRDVYHQNYDEISQISDAGAQVDRLCELNVETQVRNVARTSIVQKAWRDDVELAVHGWVYSLKDGILQDLDVGISSLDELHAAQRLGG